MTKPTMTNQTANTEAGQIPEAPIYWDNRQAAAWRDGYESGRSAAIAALTDALAAFQKVLEASTRWSRTEKVPIEVMDEARVALAKLKGTHALVKQKRRKL